MTQEDFDDLLVRFVVCGGHEFSIVEEKQFRQLLLGKIYFTIWLSKHINIIIFLSNLGASGGKFKIMSRYSLQQKIMKKYEIGKEDLIELLETVKYVCLSSDLWSHRRKSYLGVTVHFINDKMERVSLLLTCRLFSVDHTSTNIASELQAIVHEFELQDKVIATITDSSDRITSKH